MNFQITTRDRELLQRNFVINDPTALAHLVRDLPTGTVTPEVEFEYDARPPGGRKGDGSFVWCAHCQKPSHWIGFVMKYANGKRITVGKDCGYKIYGISFTGIERDFRQQSDRKKLLEILLKKIEALPKIVEQTQSLLEHECYIQLASLQETFKSKFVPLSQQLKQFAWRPDAWLSAFDKVRDHAAEDRRSEKNAKISDTLKKLSAYDKERLRNDGKLPILEDEKKHIYKNVERRVMKLNGAAMFIHTLSDKKSAFSKHTLTLKARSNSFVNVLSDALTNRQIQAELTKCKEIAEAILEIHNSFRSAAEFFELDHLNSLVSWASSYEAAKGRYKIANGNLVYNARDGAGDDISMKLPNKFTFPDMSFLDPLLK